MAKSTFSRLAGSTYHCDTCGRLTRNTCQSFSCRLCAQCFDLAGISNEISDGHVTLADKRSEIDALLAEIRSKGGKPDVEFADLLGDGR